MNSNKKENFRVEKERKFFGINETNKLNLSLFSILFFRKIFIFHSKFMFADFHVPPIYLYVLSALISIMCDICLCVRLRRLLRKIIQQKIIPPLPKKPL
jgi:hypothetical protein